MAAVAPIQPLARELLYAVSAALKTKKQKKKKTKTNKQKKTQNLKQKLEKNKEKIE